VNLKQRKAHNAEKITLISTLIVTSLLLAGCAATPTEIEDAASTPTNEATQSATPTPTESESQESEDTTQDDNPVIKAEMTVPTLIETAIVKAQALIKFVETLE
jgi:hypothetical protein